jgi:hypothetical protein
MKAYGGVEVYLPPFLTCGQLHVAALLSPGTGAPVPIGYEAGWAPEPVWTPCKKEKSLASCLGRPARTLVIIPTELSSLCNFITRITVLAARVRRNYWNGKKSMQLWCNKRSS